MRVLVIVDPAPRGVPAGGVFLVDHKSRASTALALTELFQRLYNAAEFDFLLAGLVEDVRDTLVTAESGLATRAFSAAETLVRRGLVDDALFSELLRNRPLQAQAIYRARAKCLGLPEWPGAPRSGSERLRWAMARLAAVGFDWVPSDPERVVVVAQLARILDDPTQSPILTAEVPATAEGRIAAFGEMLSLDLCTDPERVVLAKYIFVDEVGPGFVRLGAPAAAASSDDVFKLPRRWSLRLVMVGLRRPDGASVHVDETRMHDGFEIPPSPPVPLAKRHALAWRRDMLHLAANRAHDVHHLVPLPFATSRPVFFGRTGDTVQVDVFTTGQRVWGALVEPNARVALPPGILHPGAEFNWRLVAPTPGALVEIASGRGELQEDVEDQLDEHISAALEIGADQSLRTKMAFLIAHAVARAGAGGCDRRRGLFLDLVRSLAEGS
jgi:hypothetical protein